MQEYYTNVMKIRYLKTKEEFELEVPDPLNDGETIMVRITDYDLFMLLNSNFDIRSDLDDDTFRGIELLSEKYSISIRTLTLAKRQQHLRQLNRVETSWVELNKRERKPRTNKNEDNERLEYLRENFDRIAENCARHDWFDEYLRLCKDMDRSIAKAEVRQGWKALKKKFLYL